MSFEYPFTLIAFTIFIPIFIYDLFAKKNEIPRELKKKLMLSTIFFRTFIVFSILALSGPKWGAGFAMSEYRRGLDAVFAVDVSRSMDIRDSRSGSQMSARLARGLSIAAESAASVSGARFAAALGRGKAYLAVPLTYNDETVISFLQTLDVSSMTGRSTNLEALIDTAADAFHDNSPARKAIILISDGESHLGVLANAINRCVREGLIVTVVAVGSDEGMPVPGADSSEAGNVISGRNSYITRMMSERTGGIYIDGNSEDASSQLTSHLLSLSQKAQIGSGKLELKQRRALFIILAILAYAVSKFIPFFGAAGRIRKGIIISLALILTSCSEGKLLLMEANYLFSRGRYEEAIIPYQKALQFEDSAPYAEYGLGLTFYLHDDGLSALNRYNNSKKILMTHSDKEDRELRYRIFYNSGIIYFEEEDYVSAAEAFRDALKINPEKIEAKRNLEISLMSITLEKRENQKETRSETKEVLFDYIKQREQQYWKSGEWTRDEPYTKYDY